MSHPTYNLLEMLQTTGDYIKHMDAQWTQDTINELSAEQALTLEHAITVLNTFLVDGKVN